MKVLFINRSFPNPVEPNRGNFVLKNICAYPTDIEVTVIAPVPFGLSFRRSKTKEDVPLEETVSCGERRIRVLHPRFLLFPRNILRILVPYLEYWLIRNMVKRLVQDWKADLIHANFASPDGIAAARLSKELNIPLVITEHQAALDRFLKIGYLNRQMLAAYHKANKVICVSEHTLNIIMKADPGLRNLVVIPNGVDFSRFKLREPSKQLKKLIYIGYLIPHKGVQVLIKALALLKKEGIVLFLTIVGDGYYKGELQRLCESHKLNEQVTFTGEKNPSQVAELLGEHDAMVHPSFMESFGIVMVEALASGLPVLSTFNGGAEGILSPETGILVKPNDSAAIAEGIKELIKRWDCYDPAILRNYAQQRFSLSEVAMQTVAVYKEVL
jgi:glycosyltransferase involved in cell wall biosynthesis